MILRRLLIVIASGLLLAGCKVDADFSGEVDTRILPAEQYQREIVAIDRLLFRDAPLGEEGVKALEKELDDLAPRVLAVKPDSRFLKLESLELQLLARRAARLSPDVTGAALQNDWMRIRKNLFDDRAWFARSANDLEYAAKVTAPAPAAAPPAAIATVAPATSTEVREIDKARSTLTGRWEVVSITANGEPREDEELSGSTWTFDLPRLILRSRNGTETVFNATPDGHDLAVTSPHGEDGWMKYEIDREGLRVGFFDGLKGKPASFEADRDRKDPLLIVVRLVPVR